MPGSASRPSAREVGDPHAGVGDRGGGVAVRADLERVVALQLEQVGDLVEHAGDRGLSITGCRGHAYGHRRDRGLRSARAARRSGSANTRTL